MVFEELEMLKSLAYYESLNGCARPLTSSLDIVTCLSCQPKPFVDN